MSFDIPTCRKSDLAILVGAMLLLWGPGFTQPADPPPAAAHAVPAAAVLEDLPGPCQPDPVPVPETAPDGSANCALVRVTVTGYCSDMGETDDSPNLTATNSVTRTGVIALSQDLLREFTPGAPFTFHDIVEIPGLGHFSVEDTMHPRWARRADIWFSSRDDALRWGRRPRSIYRVPDDLAQTLLAPGRSEVLAAFGKANFQ